MDAEFGSVCQLAAQTGVSLFHPRNSFFDKTAPNSALIYTGVRSARTSKRRVLEIE
jgi:hypothetical protein